MADCISFEYREDEDLVLVKIGQNAQGNEFRNPLKDSCNLLREKSGAAYIIEPDKGFTPGSEDAEWITQHFIPIVKRSCAGRIILIIPEGDPRREAVEEKYGSLIGFFFAGDYEEALKVLKDIDLKEKDNGIKIAGKTKKQWRDHFSYVWFKYSIFPIAIAIIALLFFGLFGRQTNDVVVYSFGYFEVDETYMEEVLKNEGYKVPYFPAAVVVTPNQEGKKPTQYENESASAYFMTNPDVIVTDGATYGYYYQCLGVYPEAYERILNNLSEKAKENVEPVYMSAAEADEYVKKFNAWSGKTYLDEENPSSDKTKSDKKAIVGFRIKDKEACSKLGYRTGWTTSDSRLVLSMYSKCADQEKAEKVLTVILNSAF